MNESLLLVNYLTSSLIAGVIGTSIMTLFVYVASRYGFTSIGIVQAVGSVVTGQVDKKAIPAGAILHTFAGIAFAMLYTLLFFSTPMHNTPYLLAPLGALLGAAHGFVMFFLLVPLLAENHPIKLVRDNGAKLALTYFFAHIVYGLTVGAALTYSPLFN